MDPEEIQKASMREQETLQRSLMDEAGTPDQAAQWLARLQEIDPEHFDDFIAEYQDHLQVRERTRAFRQRLHDPVRPAELADMVRAIRAYPTDPQASSDDDYWDYQARFSLLHQANRDADWAALVFEVGGEVTAEEIVDRGLAQRRRIFAMPGPVDGEWVHKQNQGE